MSDYTNKLDELARTANEFIQTVEIAKLNKPIYTDGWNSKEIVAHIVFYHEYYSKVVSAISSGHELPLIDESLAKVNKWSAIEYSKLSRKVLISKFKKAQQVLYSSLAKLDPMEKIPYKKGGRVYNAIDYVAEITRHMAKHIKDLRKVKRKSIQILSN